MLIQKETCLWGWRVNVDSDSVEAINMDLEKKQKLDEGSHTLDQVSQFEAAEVARQPRREQ